MKSRLFSVLAGLSLAAGCASGGKTTDAAVEAPAVVTTPAVVTDSSVRAPMSASAGEALSASAASTDAGDYPKTPEEADLILARMGAAGPAGREAEARAARLAGGVLDSSDAKAGAARMLWTGALLRAASVARDEIRQLQFLEQLRLCARPDQAARVRTIGAASSNETVRAFAYRVADEIENVFGVTRRGERAHLYTLEGKGGLRLVVSDFGGRVVQCWAPDAQGAKADITLGWNTPAEYEKYGCGMGALIGRYANRIARGRFTLDGETYQLPVNETNPPPRHAAIHCGPDGWDARVWRARRFDDGDDRCLALSLFSPHGESGLPGNVEARVTYRVTPDNVWRIEYEATTDRPTVLDLAHCGYWNLAGEASGSMLNQCLRIVADSYTRADEALIPIADASVTGTGFDFRELRPIAAKADLMLADPETAPTDFWYNHNFVLRDGVTTNLHFAAEMEDPVSGRVLEVWTTEPCLQVYAAQNFSEALPAKAKGKRLCPFAGLALETQHYPDSPNRSGFPSTVLRPGETYRSVTEYRFRARPRN